MSYCISKEGAQGKPLFLSNFKDGVPEWGDISHVKEFSTEQEAWEIVDSSEEMLACIVLPYNETINISNHSYSHNMD